MRGYLVISGLVNDEATFLMDDISFTVSDDLDKIEQVLIAARFAVIKEREKREKPAAAEKPAKSRKGVKK